MVQSLSTELLARILKLVAGPSEERCFISGNSAVVLPVVLGADSRELCKLRLVSKGFQDALRTIPLHVTATTVHRVRSLSLLHAWDIAAVQLFSSTAKTSELLIKAACALPERDRNKVVSVGLPGTRVADLAPWLRQLEGVRHMNILRSTIHLDCLSHIEHLDLTRLGDGEQNLMVRLLPPPKQAACRFSGAFGAFCSSA